MSFLGVCNLRLPAITMGGFTGQGWPSIGANVKCSAEQESQRDTHGQ